MFNSFVAVSSDITSPHKECLSETCVKNVLKLMNQEGSKADRGVTLF